MDKIIYQNEKDDEQEIDVAEILMYLLHWIWLIAIAGIITAAIYYHAAVQIFNQDLYFKQKQFKRYADIFRYTAFDTAYKRL